MADSIQFTLTAAESARFLAWRHHVDTATGPPLEGVIFSFTLTRQGERQILVRLATAQDFKLQGVALLDGTSDTFAPHETVLAEYDDLGFASTTVHWRDVGLRLHLCAGLPIGEETTPRCYVECLNTPHQPLLPFRVSDQPELLKDDVLLRVFPYTPLPPDLHRLVQQYLRTNVTVLLQHWRGEIDSAVLLDTLQPPGDAYNILERRAGVDE